MTEPRADAALHPGAIPADGREPATMTLAQVKVLGIATLGGIFEFYEFIIFIYLAPIIGQHFFPADMPVWLRQVQTLGIFAAGYLIRPVGGVILANVGDFIGRKRMFAFTLILLAVPTIAIGCLPGYAQIGIGAPLLLLLCRMVQGLSIGASCRARFASSPSTCRSGVSASAAASSPPASAWAPCSAPARSRA